MSYKIELTRHRPQLTRVVVIAYARVVVIITVAVLIGITANVVVWFYTLYQTGLVGLF